MATDYATIVVRRGNADAWENSQRPLASGEWGYDETNRVAKIGDGYTMWRDLPASSSGLTFNPGTGLFSAGTADSIPSVEAGTSQLPDAVRQRIAANLADVATPEGAAVAGASAGIPFDTESETYKPTYGPAIPSVDEGGQFPEPIRAAQAANLRDASTVEGDALAQVTTEASAASLAYDSASRTYQPSSGQPIASFDPETGLFAPQVLSALDKRFGSRVYPEQFGAVADGVTDDTAAIQAGADYIRARGGGVLSFSCGKSYGLLGTVILGSRTLLDGNNATIQKLFGGTSTSFVNHVAPGAVGYGSGAQDITFRDLRIKGNYDAPGVLDGSTGWNHVDNLNFLNVEFVELQQNAHAVDLGGCRNVKFIGCTFAGLKTVAGREYVEAIQIDSSSYIGSSWKAWPTNSYDGLPTRGVLVDGCTFTTLTKNGTTYGMPNPMGSHGSFGGDDTAYYEDIRFVNNRVVGFNTPTSGTAFGWLHFRSLRNATIKNNTFEYTGPPSLSGYPTVISILSTTSAYTFADAASTSPATAAVSPPLNPQNIDVSYNKFKNFRNAPVLAGSALINIVGANNSEVVGNIFDGLSSTAILNAPATGGDTNDGLTIALNRVTTQSTEPAILATSSVLGQIKDNTIRMSAGGIGIQVDQGNAVLVQGNVLYAGATGVLIRGCSNTSVQNNLGTAQTTAAYSVGPAGYGTNASDTVLMGNRSRATAAGTAGILIGSTGSRTKMQANTLLSTVPVTDGGTGTTTPVPNIVAA
ncbi:hypothetical protein DEJ17_06535 [Curtobacterium sp. MCSS17_011]|uniref:right-handed parallel beta-helix repeat-containing protein n=1 Tax=Curtobacterium sp. MCSS17_011 TaxID=2175643 RepID=UPI000D9E4C63|nr:right-handed parallel beta-helix repeat-containing protein [Curtobacterium sp. MCSS17_011]PYY60023.1 hypothetical protein DEJ17_06535 [Curtobacterium sp. MCSS17_011]